MKIIKFIKDKVYNIVSTVKVIHDKLKQFDDKTQSVPYLEVFNWIVEVLYFGLLMAIVYLEFTLTGWKKWVLIIPAFGILRLLWFDFVENTAYAVKGSK